jgi:hypothetical protein
MADKNDSQDPASNGASVGAPEPAENNADSLDGSKAFDVLLPSLEAQPPAPVINTDVGMVAQTALSMPKRLGPILEDLIVAVPNYEFERNLQLLKTTALSLNFLQAKYRVLRSTRNTSLVDWLTNRRFQFHAFGQVLSRHGIVDEADLDALRHTNNHHALGYDVMGLAELLLTHYDYIACKLLTREQLLEARAKANELFLELGTREFGPNAAEEVKLLRRKNFALLVKQFTQLEDAVRYGRSAQGDADKYVPTLYPKRGARKGEEDIDEGELSGADPTPAASSPTSIPNAGNADGVLDVAAINRSVSQGAANANGIGLPTSVPFRVTEEP